MLAWVKWFDRMKWVEGLYNAALASVHLGKISMAIAGWLLSLLAKIKISKGVLTNANDFTSCTGYFLHVTSIS